MEFGPCPTCGESHPPHTRFVWHVGFNPENDGEGK